MRHFTQSESAAEDRSGWKAGQFAATGAELERVLYVRADNASAGIEKPRLVDTSTQRLIPRDGDEIIVLCGGWLVRLEDDGGRFVSVNENGFVMSIG